MRVEDLERCLAIGALAVRSWEPSPPPCRWFPGSAGLLTIVLALMAGCGSSGDDQPELIDEAAGSFRGVKIGDNRTKAANAFGKSCVRPNIAAPCGDDPVAVTAPSGRSGKWRVENYEDVTIFTRKDRITALLITAEEAETSRGIGIGDSLELAKDRYPNLYCDVQQFEGIFDEPVSGDPYCETPEPAGRVVIFGGDPINSIVVGKKGIR